MTMTSINLIDNNGKPAPLRSFENGAASATRTVICDEAAAPYFREAQWLIMSLHMIPPRSKLSAVAMAAGMLC